MIDFRLLYPGFKKKAVTFSYDDGILQDVQLVEIFNKYGMKATFNLNYGQSGEPKFRLDKDGVEIDCSHLDLDKNVHLYDGHEIANHTYHHPHLETISSEEQKEEYRKNREALENLFQKSVLGAAYPYGSYDYDTLRIQKELGIEYDRTVRSTYSFNLPSDWLLWNPTIHHRDKRIMQVLDEFFEDNQELSLMYIWGHAYEFGIDHNFELMDDICRRLSQQTDILPMTNHEVYQYVHAALMVYHRDGSFRNPSGMDVYLNVDGRNIVVPAKGEFPYGEKNDSHRFR
jgi:peptidoglycan-N-acetylglucosamine deacetylase